MKKHILVGTHHKTGTTWLSDIFTSFCAALNIPFHDISAYCTEFGGRDEKREFMLQKSREGCAVFFDANSSFPRIADKEKCNFTGIRIIRDPRDIVISSTFYHQHADEQWLHIKQERFGGLTYQEKLNSLSTLDQKLIFEMNHISGQVINRINSYKSRNLLHIYKYETLVEDRGLVEWKSMAGRLYLDDTETEVFLKCVVRNSLFGKKKRKKPNSHIRSGKARQYTDDQYAGFRSRFELLFPGVLRNLGYPE